MQTLPALGGRPIRLRFQPSLTAHHGRLLSGKLERGTPVYAAAFIRERRIVLESELLARPRQLRLILLHEIFHFVWARLANGTRREFGELLVAERHARARGELGESAAVRKSQLRDSDQLRRNARWREYVCESFCDTAAWYLTGQAAAEYTLGRRWREFRMRWLERTFSRLLSC